MKIHEERDICFWNFKHVEHQQAMHLKLQFDADIVRYMENVEHICLQQRASHESPSNMNLNGLKKLKCLELYGSMSLMKKIEQKLNSMSPQNRNRIEGLRVPVYEVICKFTNLTSLKIYSDCYFPFLGMIAGEL